MFQSIPASHIVSVTPAVLSAGGSPLSMNAVFLSKNANLATSQVKQFATAQAVGEFFGFESEEYKVATVYFLGFDNSSIKPSTIYFASYNTAAEGAFLLGGSIKSLSLANLKKVTGVLSISVDGSEKKNKQVDFSEVISFSNAAETLKTAIGDVDVTFDAQLQAFKILSTQTGSSSEISFASGDVAEKLGLTEAKGATLSPSADADTANSAMQSVIANTLNWATFTTIFEPTLDEKMAFADWSKNQDNRFLYVGWGMEATATQKGNTTCFGAKLKESDYDGSVAVYGGLDKAAFICGTIASIDFTERQGCITLKFKGQAGLKPDVLDQTTATILEENGYNYYGAWATANDRFLFLAPGKIAGKWKWIDSYVNQIRLNSQLQLALITLLKNSKSIPYNASGVALQRAACNDPIREALNFGSIQEGVTLSEQQRALINNATGMDAAGLVESQGYYLYIGKATAQTRANRQTYPMKFWYADGGSVHSINLNSINVQ